MQHFIFHTFSNLPTQAAPADAQAARLEQLERKAKSDKGRGRGRGKGPGRGRGAKPKKGGEGKGVENDPEQNQQIYDDPWDPNWHWTWEWGWYWEEVPNKKASKRAVMDKDGEPKAKRAKSARSASAASAASAPAGPAEVAKKPEKKRAKPSSPEESKTVDKPDGKKKNRTGSAKDKRNPKSDAPRPEPAPTTEKAMKLEILGFLNSIKSCTEETAKDEIKKLLPNYHECGYDCSLNIYWARRGVKGIGCGVKSKSENLDVSFFGFKTICDSWVFAIAAAIKAADIHAT